MTKYYELIEEVYKYGLPFIFYYDVKKMVILLLCVIGFFVITLFISTIVFNFIYDLIQMIVPYNYNHGNRSLLSDTFWKHINPINSIVVIVKSIKYLLNRKNKDPLEAYVENGKVSGKKNHSLFFIVILPCMFILYFTITVITYHGSVVDGVYYSDIIMILVTFLRLILIILIEAFAWIIPFCFKLNLIAELLKILIYDHNLDQRTSYNNGKFLTMYLSENDKENIAQAYYADIINEASGFGIISFIKRIMQNKKSDTKEIEHKEDEN